MQREPSDSVDVIYPISRERVLSWVDQFARTVLERGGIRDVWLFGSYATGEFTYRSDVDICVVLEDSDTIWDYASLISEYQQISVDPEPQFHIYRLSDFDRLLKEGSGFLRTLVSEGIRFGTDS